MSEDMDSLRAEIARQRSEFAGLSSQECLVLVMTPSGISAYYLCLADRR